MYKMVLPSLSPPTAPYHYLNPLPPSPPHHWDTVDWANVTIHRTFQAITHNPRADCWYVVRCFGPASTGLAFRSSFTVEVEFGRPRDRRRWRREMATRIGPWTLQETEFEEKWEDWEQDRQDRQRRLQEEGHN